MNKRDKAAAIHWYLFIYFFSFYSGHTVLFCLVCLAIIINQIYIVDIK